MSKHEPGEERHESWTNAKIHVSSTEILIQ
jgi:hypothetical protein